MFTAQPDFTDAVARPIASWLVGRPPLTVEGLAHSRALLIPPQRFRYQRVGPFTEVWLSELSCVGLGVFIHRSKVCIP